MLLGGTQRPATALAANARRTARGPVCVPRESGKAACDVGLTGARVCVWGGAGPTCRTTASYRTSRWTRCPPRPRSSTGAPVTAPVQRSLCWRPHADWEGWCRQLRDLVQCPDGPDRVLTVFNQRMHDVVVCAGARVPPPQDSVPLPFSPTCLTASYVSAAAAPPARASPHTQTRNEYAVVAGDRMQLAIVHRATGRCVAVVQHHPWPPP
jgi:hypothetical protein